MMSPSEADKELTPQVPEERKLQGVNPPVGIASLMLRT